MLSFVEKKEIIFGNYHIYITSAFFQRHKKTFPLLKSQMYSTRSKVADTMWKSLQYNLAIKYWCRNGDLTFQPRAVNINEPLAHRRNILEARLLLHCTVDIQWNQSECVSECVSACVSACVTASIGPCEEVIYSHPAQNHNESAFLHWHKDALHPSCSLLRPEQRVSGWHHSASTPGHPGRGEAGSAS